MRVRRPAALAASVILSLCASSIVQAAATAPGLAAAATGEADARPLESALAPYVAVRALQTLQDRIAHGNVAAQAAQGRMLDHIAEVFATVNPTVWKEGRNANAAALYLFSAGHAAVVREVLEHDAAFTADGRRLVEGALAYAEGQDDLARRQLGSFDPRTLPPALGGHLALVLATLLTDQDPVRAGAMLDAARLIVPGTLVEEAALRRQIFLVADIATLDKFTALSRQYIRRFRSSVFASNFKGRLTSFAVRLAVAGDVAPLTRLEPVFTELPQAERRGLYLTLARDAVLAGRPEAARYAAARAAGLALDPAETERARLYTAAAGVASDAAPTARAALSGLDATRLTPRDAELRMAAEAVADSVNVGMGEQARDTDRGGLASTGSATDLLDRAHRAMDASDAILSAAAKVTAADPGSAVSPTAKAAAAPAGTTP
ncbi:MAG: hypothetical protein ACRYGP_23150 [Janthinobacterium lividum]